MRILTRLLVLSVGICAALVLSCTVPVDDSCGRGLRACATGYACVEQVDGTGRCLLACDELDLVCPEALVCRRPPGTAATVCVAPGPLAAGDPCVADFDCGLALACGEDNLGENRICRAQCVADAECPADSVCWNGCIIACDPDDASTCGAARFCFGGSCVDGERARNCGGHGEDCPLGTRCGVVVATDTRYCNPPSGRL